VLQKKVTPIIIILSSSFFFLIGLLFFEYRSLIYHNKRLQELKNEYRMHVQEVKKILTNFHVKQPSIGEDGGYGPQEAFVAINRDLDYLKQQSQKYIKQQNLESYFHHVSEDIWLDYTDVALIEKKTQFVQPKKSKSKKKVMCSASSNTKKKKCADLFSWPINHSNFWLSSLYGRRKNANGSWGFHRAIDMAAIKGTPVKAAASGVVTEARNAQRGYGKTIVIRHNNKYKTRYAHLNAMHVAVGQKVSRGMHIGDVGDSGFVRKTGKDASHLHFELSVFGERVNPLYYLA